MSTTAAFTSALDDLADASRFAGRALKAGRIVRRFIDRKLRPIAPCRGLDRLAPEPPEFRACAVARDITPVDDWDRRAARNARRFAPRVDGTLTYSPFS